MSIEPILSVSNLAVSYRGGEVGAVEDVSFEVMPGEMIAIVGESGSGKSTTAMAVLGLLPYGAGIDHGSVTFAGRDITSAPERVMKHLRGSQIGLVPQDPTVSLDPTQRVGAQIAESLIIHGKATKKSAWDQAVNILEEVGVTDAARRARQFPHEFSGGMRQRVLIGIAWACKPQLLIADEPTSALDVTVQKQILDRLELLRSESNIACVFVTHDLGVAAERAQKVIVMSKGRVVEAGPSREVLENPQEEYTKRLVASIPSRRAALVSSMTHAEELQETEPLIQVTDLVKEYTTRDAQGKPNKFQAVAGNTFTVNRGETLSIVGESGSGKTTTARMVMALEKPTSGSIMFDGQDLTKLKHEELRRARRRFQIVHQNPYASLSPGFKLHQIISEPMRAFKEGSRAEQRKRAIELLDQVGLPSNFADRTAAELSGGQRQRVAIARALALKPDLVVCDEPVSALDVTVQAQVLDLLIDLQKELGVSYLFISHDLTVVRAISHRIAVMRSGEIVELGTAAQVFESPQHEYTRQLLAAVPGAEMHAA